MKKLCALVLLILVPFGPTFAQEPVAAPTDVPPVLVTAIASQAAGPCAVQLTIPKITWKVVGEKRPKIEWPKLQVNVEETVLTLSLDVHPATQLSEENQNRIVDLKGRRLNREEVEERLKKKMPVLLSVSGRMPDMFYLQCTMPNTLIVIPGIPVSPAAEFLPSEAKAAAPVSKP